MEIRINNTYSGPFERVGTVGEAARFESVQSVTTLDTARLHLTDLDVRPEPKQNDLEVNTVNWTVEPNGHISGTAKFLAVTTHDLIKATLDGQATPGRGHQVARVKVTFAGGTGTFANARGTADVVAKLFDDGLSVGHIKGTLTT